MALQSPRIVFLQLPSTRLTASAASAVYKRQFQAHRPRAFPPSRQRSVQKYPFSTVGSRIARKQVTVTNDDGRVEWSDLSTREKAARTTQQTFNFVLVLLGIGMTGGVGYLLFEVVFAKDSKTRVFHRAFDEVKKSERVTAALGPPKKIKAYGEASWNRWTRNRHIASTFSVDRQGKEHMLMHFNVEGPQGRGVVNVHMVRENPHSTFEYKKLSVDIPGHATIWLRNTDAPPPDKKHFSFLGFKWR